MDKDKQCSSCGTFKPRAEFYRSAGRSDGLTCYCKECNKERNRKYQEANPEKVREYHRKYCVEARVTKNQQSILTALDPQRMAELQRKLEQIKEIT